MITSNGSVYAWNGTDVAQTDRQILGLTKNFVIKPMCPEASGCMGFIFFEGKNYKRRL